MQEVRRLTPAAFEHYYTLRGAGLVEAPAAFTTDASAWLGADRVKVERHLEASRDDPSRPIFGAWSDGELVGLIGLSREPRESVSHKASLWGLYVSPNHRRQGLGRSLLAEAISAARDLPGLRQLRAVVPTACDAAIGLFKSLGFEEFGLERDARWVNGRFHDQLYLWLLFRNAEDS
ncbi:MAG TPA: GNAT family N-acetyltransferase [Actinomycetota bacterium]|nr:GNAT family N-acetyltransferase [Actinomycetota bacterium]